MGIYVPTAAFEPRTLTLGLSRLDRKTIEAQIEELISLLDHFDGDPDLEDDDPSGDPLDSDGEHPADDGRELLPLRPIYGIDQTTGPINAREALNERSRLLLRDEFR